MDVPLKSIYELSQALLPSECRAWRSDIGLYPVASIDCDRATAAEGAMLSVPVIRAPTVYDAS